MAQSCGEWRAEIISVEGKVELDRGGSGAWSAAAPGDTLCVGDLVRVLAYARAALRLPDDTVLRLDQNTTTRWAAPEGQNRSLLELLKGVIHVISRDPRALSFRTPFANAGLEGTEFVIDVTDEQAAVTVLEGVVVMANGAGTAEVAAGQRGTVRGASATVVTPAPDAQSAIQWALYYAPVLAEALPAPDQVPPVGQQDDPRFFAARAAGRLLVGRVAEARTDLDHALGIDPANPDARALQAVISATFNELPQAELLADQAVSDNPSSAAALLAQSYTRQAQLDLAAARSSLEAAVRAHPDNTIAWGRLAEARLAIGDLAGGREAAQRAIAIEPNLAHAHTVLGFAQLMDLQFGDSTRSFERAVELDSAAPLPHLGLGLLFIREGELSAGRREIELAVLLDPNSAVTRSYVAKAYYEERREALPASQLDLAKTLNPAEPTPWLYDALRKQTENRPVEALRDLEHAATLNDRQDVYRSSLRLDEDLAVRSGAVGRAYRDLGFERLALKAGWLSTERDPANYSGHRLLADTYSSLPRHQIARVNELFQSQLLQPLNLTAIPPQLGETNLFILDTAGPADLAYNEFNPLLTRDHWTVQGAGIVAGNETRGEHATVSGIHDRLSYSIGQFGYETAGFRENNDLDTDVRNAFVQFQQSARTSWLAEIRSVDTEKGDLRLLFDSQNYLPLLRQQDSADSIRLGLRHALSERTEVLASAQYQDSTSAFTVGTPFSRQGSFDASAYDLQHQYHGGQWQLTTGLSATGIDAAEVTRMQIPLPVPPFEAEQTESSTTRTEQQSLYGYGHFDISDRLTATVGASFDQLDGQSFDRDELNPKLGLIWEPRAGTTVRAAMFRMLQGPLISKDIVQPHLEPTQVAGFNQYFFGSEGDLVTRYGIGIDQSLSNRLFIGAELAERNVDRSVVVTQPGPAPAVAAVKVDEFVASAYAYWTPTASLAVSAEFQLEDFDNNGEVLLDGFARLRTLRLPLKVRYFDPSGFSAGLTATFLDQSGDFGTLFAGPGGLENIISSESERFWVADASVAYRLPSRHGVLGVYVQNLLDKHTRFQDTDPENPRIMPERLVSFRFTLAY